MLNRIQQAAPWLSGALLVAVVVWLFQSEAARPAAEQLQQLTSGSMSAADGPFRSPGDASIAHRVDVRRAHSGLLAACIAALVLNLLAFAGLFFGPKASRSLRAWLLFCLLVCGWLAVTINWQSIYWLGQSRRVLAEVAAAESIAQALDREWPTYDGDYPQLGFVLGYPKGDPVSLILAGEPVAVGDLRIVAIERSYPSQKAAGAGAKNGALRFQLATPNDDTWLVRSGVEDESPETFVNGFGTRYEASRIRRLAKRWYLVVYAASQR